MKETPYVVTVGRSLGSGGREIGELLAKALGISYYDRRLIDEAAAHSGLCPEVMAGGDERQPSMTNTVTSLGYGLTAIPWYSGRGLGDDSVYQAQNGYIQHIAQQESCLIVGRSADYTLRHHPRLISIFLHANDDACAARIVARGDAPHRDAAVKLIHKINKMRAGYYNFYTDKEWGHPSSYDLCLDTSSLPAEACVAILKVFVEARLEHLSHR